MTKEIIIPRIQLNEKELSAYEHKLKTPLSRYAHLFGPEDGYMFVTADFAAVGTRVTEGAIDRLGALAFATRVGVFAESVSEQRRFVMGYLLVGAHTTRRAEAIQPQLTAHINDVLRSKYEKFQLAIN